MARLRESLDDDLGALEAWVNRADVPGIDFSDVSFAANKLNGWIARQRVDLDPDVLHNYDTRVMLLIEERIDEADADDCSRLGWIYLRRLLYKDALRLAQRGLDLEPHNAHCLNLLQRSRS